MGAPAHDPELDFISACRLCLKDDKLIVQSIFWFACQILKLPFIIPYNTVTTNTLPFNPYSGIEIKIFLSQSYQRIEPGYEMPVISCGQQAFHDQFSAPVLFDLNSRISCFEPFGLELGAERLSAISSIWLLTFYDLEGYIA
jgi:hypothetical protein